MQPLVVNSPFTVNHKIMSIGNDAVILMYEAALVVLHLAMGIILFKS